MHYEKFADGIVNCIENELPFELPNGWEWVNLGTVCDVFGRIGFRGYTKGDFVSKGEGAISLSPSNIVNNSMNYDNCSYITWRKYEESPEIMIYNGDILLVKTGSSYGKSTIVQNLPEKATINPQFVVLKNSRIITSYLCYFLQSSYCISMYEKFVGGTAIPTFSQANLKAMYVPVPPIQEQTRIVSAIKTAEEQIILIGDNNNELQTDINLLKSKILDLAIRGKLVPQNPDDEPASVLLERIRAEKEELIKQGKIKRDKKESIIFKGEDNSYYEKVADGSVKCIDDEIPFNIPDNWLWTRVSMISEEVFAGGDKPQNFSKEQTEECPYAIYSNGVDKNGLYGFTDMPRVVKPSITVSGRGTIGFSCVRYDPFYPIIRLITITPSALISLEFLDCVFKRLLETGTGSSIPQLTVPMVKPKLIPIPPQEEQARIIKMINEIFVITLDAEKSLS